MTVDMTGKLSTLKGYGLINNFKGALKKTLNIIL